MAFPHDLKLTDKQLKKLFKGEFSGKTVQLKNNDLSNGNVTIFVDKKTNTKIERALRKGTGMRLSLTPEEHKINGINGGSIKSAFKKFGHKLEHDFKDVGKFTGLKALNNKIRDGFGKISDYGILKPAMQLGLMSVGVDPMMSGMAATVANKALDKKVFHKGGRMKDLEGSGIF